MGLPVLIIGESGSGKSTSMRNLLPTDALVFNVASKPFPFRNKNGLKKADNVDYDLIKSVIKSGKTLSYVIDDANLLMSFELFKRVKEAGYGKFTDIACDYEGLLRFIINETSLDTIVYLLQHSETLDSGKIKAKTVGKMLDNQLTVESLFSIVLLAGTDGSSYWFETQSDGFTTCKSPMEMFDSVKIDNDLKMVDTVIREYYELKPQPKAKGENK